MLYDSTCEHGLQSKGGMAPEASQGRSKSRQARLRECEAGMSYFTATEAERRAAADEVARLAAEYYAAMMGNPKTWTRPRQIPDENFGAFKPRS